jgi:hypothetical protein
MWESVQAWFTLAGAWLASDTAFRALYATSLRSPIFTGFFTLSSFLLAAKTFIVINIKREVYESETYKKSLAKQRTVNPKLSHYGPLIRLSKLLYRSIIVALLASAAQLTIGLIPYNGVALVCLLFALVAFICVIMALTKIRQNVAVWLDQAEKESAEAGR